MSKEQYGNLLLVGTDIERKSRTPIGSYDSQILCSSCDNKIGKYDNYAVKFVKMSGFKVHPTGKGWTLNGVDQKKLKLFCISYLWRCSITERSEFSGVSLGGKHEESIRLMIKNDEAGTQQDYTTTFSRFSSGKEVGGILFPAKTRIASLTHYEGYLPGLYKFWVKVDSQSNKSLENISLGAKEQMFIHDKGDFDSSTEKQIMVRAAKKSN